MKGHKGADYKGVAQFMKFIAEAHQQMWWSVTTGYVPVTQTAIKNLEAGYHFRKNPEQWTALSQLTAKPTPNRLGHRLGNFVQNHEAIDGELQDNFARQEQAKQGLDHGVPNGDEVPQEVGPAHHP